MVIQKELLRSYVLVLLLLLLGCATTSQHDVFLFSYFKGNGEDGLHLAYSRDGFNWHPLNADQPFLKPDVGNAKLMRDPCIVQGPDGKFHMVWTAGWWEKGIGIAHSTNLKEWSQQQLIPVMSHEPTSVNCWAPEIFYDKASRQYLIYWATTIPGRFPETEDTGDNGPDVTLNHRIYYVTTTDFQTYSNTKLLYDDGFNVIDATIVKNGKQYVMFIKDETVRPEPKKNLRIAFADHISGPYSPASAPITGNYWAEGPTVIRVDNRWLVYFDKYTAHRFGVIASHDLQTWTDLSDSLHVPDGIRHGTVFRVDESILHGLLTVGQ
ncbi:glycoside hydrolase family 43 protein [candidate division KSB1 bacterium]|nr:glycoside hydrolase family 43 protein [candidate division KSB1 bacterium]